MAAPGTALATFNTEYKSTELQGPSFNKMLLYGTLQNSTFFYGLYEEYVIVDLFD